jgi:hypothetical protein
MHASQQDAEANVAFGSTSVFERRPRHVRFSPDSDHIADIA